MTNNINLALKEKSYTIVVGNGILYEKELKKFAQNKQVFLAYDKNLDPKLVKKLISILDSLTSFKVLSFCIESKEKNKNQITLNEIYGRLIENHFSRDCLLLGMGGGIVCDLLGFAAATYQRGVNFILIPTSLLAQVDASVGGKTAINFGFNKNMIGSFHQPKKVLIDTSLLSTLPLHEDNCGLVEMIKHGLVCDLNYFEWLERNILQVQELKERKIKKAISESIKIKANIVSKDEKEKGIRSILNFGHTFGHGIELLGSFRDYKHGEAVALGMLPALELSKSEGYLSIKEIERIKKLFLRSKISTHPKTLIKPEDLYEAMQSDKKKKGNKLNFILLEKLGKAKNIKGVQKKKVLEAIKLAFPNT